MTTSIIGFPRIGEHRELKFATEKYFRKEISAKELQATAKELRAKHWRLAQERGVDQILSNDFSLYDTFLDTAVLFNIVPEQVQAIDLSECTAPVRAPLPGRPRECSPWAGSWPSGRNT